MKTKEVIVGICGGIAAYKAADIVRSFKKSGIGVTCVMTKEAGEFVRPLTFQALSGRKVYQDMFEVPDIWDVQHIALAEKADALLIVPATANIIGKLASGICDDLLTCVALATKAPVFIAAAMNENMYEHKAVQDNIDKLRSFGYKMIHPRKGELACGKVGTGCLEDTDKIVAEVKRCLK